MSLLGLLVTILGVWCVAGVAVAVLAGKTLRLAGTNDATSPPSGTTPRLSATNDPLKGVSP